ncbi:GroES-like protein [Xylariaceae sp. FL1272]|nr:GroES-like protein [Xylariaceae sp. FL1272]
MRLPSEMNAVVFDGPWPSFRFKELIRINIAQIDKVSLQKRAVPKLQHENDVIVKVNVAGLCGSELHTFRGHEPASPGFVSSFSWQRPTQDTYYSMIMGHEFTGIVAEVGSAVATVKVGDKIVCPFTVSCLNCFYCKNGYSSRCVQSLLFGSEKLDGAQADYVRVPFADGTLVKAPPEIDDNALLLMADIFPTGFFGARNAFNSLGAMDPSEATAVVVGCGPVGLCALISALEYNPKHLFVVDAVDSRLEIAQKLGAEPLNFKKDPEGMIRRIGDFPMEVTDGRGADVVVEVVGLKSALETAYRVVRPFGFISSIGVHNDQLPFTATDGYDKNIRLQMGRCPVRSVFPDALKVLAKQQHLFSFMFQSVMPLADALSGYDKFNRMEVQKVIFQI